MSPRQPLAGYTVVDFTSVVAGPWCTRMLADCGARVIKVETPGSGDILRFIPPLAGGESRVHAHFNCGKQSVCIDLKSPEGIELARRLIARANIVVENFRPGVMERLGLDYASVAADRPDLIYCSVSGFGQSGPMAGAPAYAPVLHALSGFDHVQRVAQANRDAPLSSGIMIADFLSATYAFGAVQTAVINRERFGEGAWLDVSLLDCMLSLVAIQTQESQWDEDIKSIAFHPLRCADDYVMIPLLSPKNFLEMLEAIGETELLKDPRFSAYAGIAAAREELLGVLAQWTAQRKVAEVVETMAANGVPCAHFRTPADNVQDETLRARGSFITLNDPVGAFVAVNLPFRSAQLDCQARGPVPGLGEHTDAVLAELGLTGTEVEALRARKVVA